MRKVINANYVVKTTGTCGALAVDTAPECYEAVGKLLAAAGTPVRTEEVRRLPSRAPFKRACIPAFALTTLALLSPPSQVKNATEPAGCALARTPDGSVLATFNTVGPVAGGSCGLVPAAVGGTAHSLVNLTLRLDAAGSSALIIMAGPADVWYAHIPWHICLIC